MGIDGAYGGGEMGMPQQQSPGDEASSAGTLIEIAEILYEDRRDTYVAARLSAVQVRAAYMIVFCATWMPKPNLLDVKLIEYRRFSEAVNADTLPKARQVLGTEQVYQPFFPDDGSKKCFERTVSVVAYLQTQGLLPLNDEAIKAIAALRPIEAIEPSDAVSDDVMPDVEDGTQEGEADETPDSEARETDNADAEPDEEESETEEDVETEHAKTDEEEPEPGEADTEDNDAHEDEPDEEESEPEVEESDTADTEADEEEPDEEVSEPEEESRPDEGESDDLTSEQHDPLFRRSEIGAYYDPPTTALPELPDANAEDIASRERRLYGYPELHVEDDN